MNRFYFFLMFLNITIFGTTKEFYLKAFNEKEPNNLFDNCVNITTGNFVFDDEIVVNGKEPIKIKRSYLSLNNFDLRSKDKKSYDEYILAGWSYYNFIKAFFYGDRIDIIEPSAMVYSFRIPYNIANKKTNQDKINFLQNLEYLQTLYLPNFLYKKEKNIIDPKDMIVQLKGQNELFVLYPDGTKKYYKKNKDHLNEYLLRNQTLLNQNKIEYFYDGLNRLSEIRSTNPNGDKIYAWVKFNYFQTDANYKDKLKDKYDFSINTSDGKKYEFRHNNYYPLISNKARSSYPFFILEKINSNQFNGNLRYYLEYKRTHPLLKSIVLPDKRSIEISYYLLGNKNPEVGIKFFNINDFRFERVKTLQEPVGINGAFDTTYRFFYDQAFSDKLGCTTVYDKKNNKYVYYYNLDLKIEKIQRFENKNGQYFLLNEERFVWQKINDISVLISKTFLDKNLRPVFSKKYFYDNKNNLIEEKIYGNISGKTSALVLNEQNLPNEGCDVFSKKYKYTSDKRNLISEEIDDSKIKTSYFYLPDTNILVSKIISYDNEIKKRYFYEYNNDNILIKEIEDDSSSFGKDEMLNLTYRKTKYFYPKKNKPFIGLIEVIEEKYLDLKTFQEILLKKEVYVFSNFGKIIKKDIYDENNQYIYSFLYEYDEKENLISETDPLGKRYTYQYDINNNKTKEILPNGTKISNIYNSSNKITKKEIQKDDEILRFQYLYDVNKNKFLDDLNNEIKYEYDNFSNLTKKNISKLVDKKSSNSQEIYSYDEKGNITEINQNGNITKILYNIYSNPVLIIYPDNTKESFVYNLDGSLKTFVDKEKLETHYTYDFFKRITSKELVSANGELLKRKNYKYNSFALEKKESNKKTVKFYYDYAQRLIKKENIYGFDKYFEEYFYDNLSRKNKTIYNNTFAELTKKDFLERVVSLEKTDLNDFVFFKKEFEYDTLDNLSVNSFIDGKKSIEKHYFDCFKRTKKIVDAFGNEINYYYDNFFVFSDIDQIKKNNFINQTIDKSSKEAKVVLFQKNDRDGNIFYKEENYYDGLNNLSLKKLFSLMNGKEEKKDIFCSYDRMNRLNFLLEKEKDFEKETKYTYTNKGYIKNIKKPDGIIIEKEYDNHGNVLNISSSDEKCKYVFEYNHLNLPIKITDLINELQVIRKYNSFGNLIEEKLANNLKIKKEYDTLKRKTNVIYPDKSSVRYCYDPFYLQKVIRQSPSKQTLYSHEYLKYDLSGNLLQEKMIEDLGIINYQLDLLGKKTSIESPYGIEEIEKYDFFGEIEKVNWKVFWKKNDFQYEDFNELIKEKKIFKKTNNLSSQHTYDKNGNVCCFENEKGKITYIYDSLNRLIQIQKDENIIEFIYDGLNRKVFKNVYKLKDENKVSSFKYLYDEFDEIGTYSEKNKLIDLKISGKDKTKFIAYEIANNIYVPIYDLFGNVSLFLPSNQGFKDIKEFFWNKKISSSFEKIKDFSNANPWQHLENEIGEEIDLFHFDTNFYDPLQRKLLNPNPFNLFLKDTKRSFLQTEGTTDIKEKKDEIISLDIGINNLFKWYNIDIFSKKNPTNIKFSKEALAYMLEEKISVDFVIDAIKRPSDIQKIEDSKFLITYRNFKMLIDMQTKEILYLEKK